MSHEHESSRKLQTDVPELNKRRKASFDNKSVHQNVEKVAYAEEIMDEYLHLETGTDQEERRRSSVIAICALFKYSIGYNHIESYYKQANAETMIFNPKLEYVKKGDFISPHMDREIYDITLTQILRGKEPLARKEPIKVFGHILHRATELYSHTDDVTSEWIRANKHLNFIFGNLGSFNQVDLKKTAQEEPRLTPEMIRMASEVYNTYDQSYREIFRIFSNPNDPRFSEFEDFYNYIKTGGSSDNLSHLINQFTGLQQDAKARLIYHHMQNYLNSGNECELYRELSGIIEESYEGMTGDEFSEFGIPKQEMTEDIQQIEIELHQLKNKTTKKVGKKFEKMYLNSQEIPENGVKVYIEGTAVKNETLLTFGVETPNGDREVRTVRLFLFKGGKTTWDFLKTKQELPEEYYSMTVYARSILRDVVESFHSTKQPAVGNKKEKIHVRDEVYDLRKQRSETNDPEHGGTEQTLLPFEQRATIHTDSEFCQNLSEENPELVGALTKALHRYHEGYRNMKKMGASDARRNLFSLREGNYRIIIEQEKDTGVLRVVDMGDRKEIYRRYK